MDEKHLKLQSQLLAVEHLLIDLYVLHLVKSYDDPAEAVDRWKIILQGQMGGVTFPNLSPVESDLASAEMTAAVERLAGLVSERVAQEQARRTPSG